MQASSTNTANAIPVPRRVDLLILGGSLAAVACGLAARKRGLSVLLAAPGAGLADDIADHLRFAAEAPLSDDLAAAVFPDGICPSPLHARRCCEQGLLDAGAEILLDALPCGLVRNAAGEIQGAVISHRGGRSAIVAGQVVDALMSAPLARLAGCAFTPWSGGSIRVESRYLSAEPLDAEELAILNVPSIDGQEQQPMRLSRRFHDLPLAAWDCSSLNQLESKRQLLAFDRQAATMSDWGFWIAPCQLSGSNPLASFTSAEDFDWSCLDSGIPGLWLLSPAARLGPAAAAHFAKPAIASAIGAGLGQRLPQKTTSKQGLNASLPGPSIHDLGRGSLRGELSGFRPGDENPCIALDDSQAPLLGSYGVMVAGGGTGGAPAGIGAARQGAVTLVCERLHRLGGVGTLGRIGRYWCGNRSGFTSEVDQRVFNGYGEARYPERKGVWWATEHKQDAWLRMLNEAGGQCWFGSHVCAALMDGTRLRGALVASRHGAGLIVAEACVDASGRADIAAAAGAPCRVVGAKHVAVQGTGLPPLMPGTDYQNSDHDFCDDNDSLDVTRMLLRSRAKFPKAWDTGALIDSRERRQIRGHYELTPLDICCDRRFPDAIGRPTSNFDSHGFTVHPVFTAFPMDKKPMKAWLPYRCLLPQQVDGILVNGLGISAHRDALPVVRMQPDVQNAGFSCGVAAAMAAAQGIGTAQLEVRQLQQRLVELGHLDAEVLDMNDSFPLPAAELERLLGEEWGSLKSIAAAFANGSAVWPILHRHLGSDNPAIRRQTAIVLGLQGDETAAKQLRQELSAGAWDEGWHFTGMHQFGPSLSPIDVCLVALAHCARAEDLPLFLDLAESLPADSAFSHVRALSWSASIWAERLPDQAASWAKALEGLLQRPGMGGHAWLSLDESLREIDDDLINTSERQAALRELHLAVAAWRCGARELAGQTLERYAQDLRGHYRRHAQAVLQTAALAAAV